MNAAKVLGVDPVISAKEMGDSDVDHLGVMAYAARLQSIAPTKKNISQPVPHWNGVKSPEPPKKSIAKDVVGTRHNPTTCIKIVSNNNLNYVQRKVGTK